MELYGTASGSIAQKIVIIAIEILLLWVSYWILFQKGGTLLYKEFGLENPEGNFDRRLIIFILLIIVFLRMTFMMLYLLKRKIPWQESVSIPGAFTLYYVGFSLLAYNGSTPVDLIDLAAILIFILGSVLNTCSEVQRHFWKQSAANKGNLYTKGLFKYSMHINYFGDVLWVSACAIITRNYYSAGIPVLLFVLFVRYNIPALDAYLEKKYKHQFAAYRNSTKKLIPFIY